MYPPFSFLVCPFRTPRVRETKTQKRTNNNVPFAKDITFSNEVREMVIAKTMTLQKKTKTRSLGNACAPCANPSGDVRP